jgi:hypothetical protein
MPVLVEVVPSGCAMHEREGGDVVCAEAAMRIAETPAR